MLSAVGILISFSVVAFFVFVGRSIKRLFPRLCCAIQQFELCCCIIQEDLSIYRYGMNRNKLITAEMDDGKMERRARKRIFPIALDLTRLRLGMSFASRISRQCKHWVERLSSWPNTFCKHKSINRVYATKLRQSFDINIAKRWKPHLYALLRNFMKIVESYSMCLDTSIRYYSRYCIHHEQCTASHSIYTLSNNDDRRVGRWNFIVYTNTHSVLRGDLDLDL